MNTLTTPIIEYLESIGYKLELNNGDTIVKNYNNTEEAIDSLYDGVGLRNISHSGIIELKGNDVLDFIHRIATNDVKNLPKEGIADTIFTTEKGKIIDYTTLLNFESHQLLITSLEFRNKIVSWINKYIITDDVKTTVTENKYNVFELLGPQAESFATLICGNIVNQIQLNTFKIIHTEGMLFFLAKIKDIRGKIKYWTISDEGNARRLMKYILDNKGIFSFNFIGEDAYNCYRIEQGIPVAPHEINDEVNPHEAGLMNIISSTKGCYIGQEVIARLETYDKVQKYISGLEFLEQPSPEARVILQDENGKEVGNITSYVYSLKFKKYIGLGYIRKNYRETDKGLIAKDQFHRTIPVVVKSLPFKK
jgi:folate-binding protein YgfZ